MENKVEKTPSHSNNTNKQKQLNKKEDSLRELHDNMKDDNIHITRIPERKEMKQGIENQFEKMTVNFPNLVKEKVLCTESHIKINPNRPTPRQIIIKMAKFKDKERILMGTKVKQIVIYKGTLIRLSADFSTETL